METEASSVFFLKMETTPSQSIGSKKDPKKCDICAKTFTYPSALKKHIDTVHEGKKTLSLQSLWKIIWPESNS